MEFKHNPQPSIKNMKSILLLAAMACISFSVQAQDWNGTTYKFNEIYPGYIISLSGDTTRGYVEHNGRTYNQKHCIFYPDASKKDRQKYKASEINGYGVADKHYRSINFTGGLLGKPLGFVLLIKPGRVSQFIYYSKKDNVLDVMGKNETMADYEARVHTDEIVWQKEGEKPFQQTELVLGFAKKISKLLSDYPELSEKVENKEKGYGIMNIYNIMDEYNAWWAAKKK